jgi:hypothetical protein
MVPGQSLTFTFGRRLVGATDEMAIGERRQGGEIRVVTDVLCGEVIGYLHKCVTN